MIVLKHVYRRCIDSLTTPNISLIEGPPGTGKSVLITNLILQLLNGFKAIKPSMKLRILVCAHSNAAVDVIAKQLIDIRLSSLSTCI